MKKIFALVLAAAMLSTTAFAGDVHIGTGGSNLNAANPGEEMYATADDFTGLSDAAIDWRFSSEYFTIASKKFSKGATLVKEVKFNDDDAQLLIVLNDNYDLTQPKNSPNLVIDKLEVKARKDYKTGTKPNEVTVIDKGATYKYNGNRELWVGYDINENELDGDANFENGELVKFVDAGGQTPYATAELSESDVYLEGRVYKSDKVFVKVDNKVDKEILKASEEADIRFYNVKTNGFPSSTTIQLAVEEDEFVYKIVDGKLTASGLKWSDDDYAWTGKIRSSVSYVVSDIELKNVSASAEGGTGTGNPDTGANDVVGIAAALAVVSLVAAGAVSLKK